MSLKIFHQVGHIGKWNIESYFEDGQGDGLILSPVHQAKNVIESFDQEKKEKCFFDPQFYLPNSRKIKLKTYDFFPETISGGFTTLDFSSHAFDSARSCIEFQVKNNFDRLIIPTRFISQMESDYFEKQEAFALAPFLLNINEIGCKLPVYITIALTTHMVFDEQFRKKILNWITKFPEIDGVYLIIRDDRSKKQIIEKETILQSLNFFSEIIQADLELVVGYTNTESLLYSLAGDLTLTMGSFENTRIFSIDKFLVSDDDRRGPKARIYLPGLLNWIQIEQAKEIKKELPSLWTQIYDETSYGNAALTSPVEPKFNQPDLYKHYFESFYKQFCTLKSISFEERYITLRGWIKAALKNYEAIERGYIDIEKHGDSEHLQSWLNAINIFYKENKNKS